MASVQIFRIVTSTILAAMVISIAIRLINGETWESALKQRRGEQSAMSIIFAILTAMLAWEEPDFWMWTLAALMGIFAVRKLIQEIKGPSATHPVKPPAPTPDGKSESN
jgi:surface polysaccharide O-acyltransferase-like enzyme